MKFYKLSQLLLVSAASLLIAGLVTACGTLTVDFVFVTSSLAAGPNNYGEVDVFEINSESGFMRQIPTSPFPSGGRDPVAEATSSDSNNLFVVNQDDNTIVQFVIGNDGKLYPDYTVNTPGIFPLAIAVNGSNLFVLDTYQPLSTCSPAEPCSGAIAVYPVAPASGNTPDTMGPPVGNTAIDANYWPINMPGKPNDVVEPTAITVLHSGAYLYVAAYDATAGANFIFGFSVGSGGVLNPLNGGKPLGGTLTGGAIAVESCASVYHNAPFVTGTCPSAITSDPSSAYVYVTDVANGKVLGYSVDSGTGLLSALAGNPFPAGDQPSAIVVDPVYPFVYVTNSLDSTVTAYSMSSGALTSLGTYGTGLQPIAIGIDPSTNHFLYTANFLGNSVSGNLSGFQLSPTAGTLINSQGTPYPSHAQPTAVAAITHGSSPAK